MHFQFEPSRPFHTEPFRTTGQTGANWRSSEAPDRVGVIETKPSESFPAETSGRRTFPNRTTISPTSPSKHLEGHSCSYSQACSEPAQGWQTFWRTETRDKLAGCYLWRQLALSKHFTSSGFSRAARVDDSSCTAPSCDGGYETRPKRVTGRKTKMATCCCCCRWRRSLARAPSQSLGCSSRVASIHRAWSHSVSRGPNKHSALKLSVPVPVLRNLAPLGASCGH